jgi:hypothetical protein
MKLLGRVFVCPEVGIMFSYKSRVVYMINIHKKIVNFIFVHKNQEFMKTTCKLIKAHSCNPYATWTLQPSQTQFFQCVCVEYSCFHAGFFYMAKPVSTVFHPGYDATKLMAQDYCGFSTHVDQTTEWQHNCHFCKMNNEPCCALFCCYHNTAGSMFPNPSHSGK